jgi:hypothetical protein
MRQRGRQATNVITVEGGRRRLEPPADLTATEAAIFREIIATCSADHFVDSDRHLLVSFVQATLLSRKAAKTLETDATALQIWDKATKMQATLATRLRLAPQARTDPKALARKQAAHRPPSAYDLMKDQDD